MLNYKGYIGDVVFDSDAHTFHGDVVNTRDVITFEGESVSEIEQAFRDSVDDYLEWCKEDGVEPERPFSGKFVVRIPPELHGEVVAKARKAQLSLNKFVEKSIMDELQMI